MVSKSKAEPHVEVDECDDEAVLVAYIQEVDDLVSRRFRRYPAGAIVAALCICLAGLLGALLDDGKCTTNDVRELLRDIESNALGTRSPADK